MAADDTEAENDAAAIHRACQRALWETTPGDRAELQKLIADLEGYIRQLAPRVAFLALRMQGEMQSTALVVLRHADEVLDEAAPSEDLSARLYDLGVVARALLTLHERPGDLIALAEAPGDELSADLCGWLVALPPMDPPEA
ncbi:DUF6415 family natural product biosynthesis protein [Streptomyces sp. NPDC013178]|uniref:DUF6415 family natural product biosynthesis protein n=1 Tax=Streptomyces sp. NPDC013178 TaxID=3155118 RepID=UPI0033C00091